MRLPCAFGDLHVGEDSSERGVLGRAGVDSETYLVRRGAHVADAHLTELDAVMGALDAEVVRSSREAVPHRLHVGRNRRRRPVGVSVVRHDAAEVLEAVVLVLHGRFQPVLAVKIHDDAALVEAMMTLGEVRLYDEAKVLLPGAHLQDRRVVVAEMVVRALPEVGARSGFYRDRAVLDGKARGLARPL